MTRTRTALLVVLCFVSTTSLGEELSAAKHADIEKLLEMTGSLAVGKQMSTAVVQQMTQMLRKARPDIPERVIGFIPEEVDAVIDENMDAFEELVVSIHHKYFTHDEIREMTRFYATPLGQKSIRVMPALMGESMQAGQQWGQSLGPTLRERIEARLKKEGFGPKPE
jgi:hypothetical protein